MRVLVVRGTDCKRASGPARGFGGLAFAEHAIAQGEEKQKRNFFSLFNISVTFYSFLMPGNVPFIIKLLKYKN